jgi:hypothetical protein
MKIVSALATSLLLGLIACTSTTTSGGGGGNNTSDPSSTDGTGDQDRGIEGDGVAAADSAPDVNPDGKAYPTDSIGWTPRSGKTPGNRIQNFKFLGYPNGDVSQGLKPISLAEYYDPTGARYSIIHIQAAGVWCSACQAETKAVVPIKDQLAAKKAVWLVSLAEGATPGTPSTQTNLNNWIKQFGSPYTHWLDPANKNLGPFYDRSALPWNANIDARTMEILTSGTGGITTGDGILSEIDDAITMASYSKLDK